MTDERIGNYGTVIGSETIAEEKILFNTVVKRGSANGLIGQADAPSDPVAGVAEFDYRRWFKDNTVRDGWEQGEPVPVKNTGEAIVTASGQINYLQNVSADTGGKVEASDDSDAVIGIALTAATNDGDRIIVHLLNLS